MYLNLIKQVLWGQVLVFVYWIEAIFRFFVPRKRKNVTGKVVLITGAGSGLGQKLSIEFAKLGCIIVGWDISKPGLRQTENEMRELGLASNWHSYICDISDRQKVYKLAKEVVDDVGEVTILINNAGIVTGKNFRDCSDELMIKSMEVNTMSHFWTIKAFLNGMLERNEGHIVTIASAAGLFGTAGLADYSASKFAAVGLAESLHMEFQFMKKSGIFSTLVCPYYIDTGMFEGVSTPLVPLLKLDYVADQIVDAVLRNKFWLILPKNFFIFYGLRGILPDKCAFVIGKTTGTTDCMKTFVGRRKSD